MLFDYGLAEDGSDTTAEDADANLVPSLVEKVALPILHHEIAHCWDMLSLQETRNAVSATSLVINYVPTSSEALGELLVAIRTRLADAVANLVVVIYLSPYYIFHYCQLCYIDLIRNSQFAGSDLESPGTEGCAECSKTCGISFWYVCSFDEEYLFVERNPCAAGSREAGS